MKFIVKQSSIETDQSVTFLDVSTLPEGEGRRIMQAITRRLAGLGYGIVESDKSPRIRRCIRCKVRPVQGHGEYCCQCSRAVKYEFINS